MSEFKLAWDVQPTGDQPQAIEKLTHHLQEGVSEQVLLGVTGSGKTFTMANTIAKLNRPALVLAHNKTLAAQLFQEFKSIFPENAVEYFISYYDYYQPEAYIPSTDTFIDKSSAINQDIDKMRHNATRILLERRDVIVVASVSCIYGLGSPKEYFDARRTFQVGDKLARDQFIRELLGLQFQRNDLGLERGKFRVRGDTVELVPANERDQGIKIRFWDNVIETIQPFDSLTGEGLGKWPSVTLFPVSHYVVNKEKMLDICKHIEKDMWVEVNRFKSNNQILEAQRLETRTLYDLEMIKEIGYCQGIENYSRYLDGRQPGEPPSTLIDFFPKDFLLFVDESHVTLPQIGGMYRGDRARKETLVQFGFRLSSALDNRPLNFEEFRSRVGQCVYVSATPGPYELAQVQGECVEQVVRPTGLVDPMIEIHPATHQVDILFAQIQKELSHKSQHTGRILVTTLTKKMSEELYKYLKDLGISCTYLHSDIDALERVKILRKLRLGEVDVLIGINLLREGLDLPEVSLVAILDADKEGFLRSRTSLIQTIGRAARNREGRVLLFADKITKSIEQAVDETNRRRDIQMTYNVTHGIDPKSIIKQVSQNVEKIYQLDYGDHFFASQEELVESNPYSQLSLRELEKLILKKTKEMQKYAQKLEFEMAASTRDTIRQLESILVQKSEHPT
jgi:excinuclease ABC subunit B